MMVAMRVAVRRRMRMDRELLLLHGRRRRRRRRGLQRADMVMNGRGRRRHKRRVIAAMRRLVVVHNVAVLVAVRRGFLPVDREIRCCLRQRSRHRRDGSSSELCDFRRRPEMLLLLLCRCGIRRRRRRQCGTRS